MHKTTYPVTCSTPQHKCTLLEHGSSETASPQRNMVCDIIKNYQLIGVANTN
jgi:hypothetical protein